ncbi:MULTISPECIES: PAS domain S-box protein [unclassified Mucilaginibacter]|uniref:PAS domain S-box protein n=1 Tax=unclassified Mucilaginibacter TaxID=2617802 RepID=UPI002AC9C31B|nr:MULTISPECIES: PAS domain S-box protein [unclassified Mucilaginibacter]MEB0248507.1 PAS domain S-box protein [Mucilaginibacter sp. 5B2]MEB0260459.1 PAS domain S-box protein [Mucilaginibacter sp. 10I4]MEB0280041.1 PAS domain S-box protein [Mucilaginibacter sp. 10B2]MEB0301321.1 PAS domain S-box protein [Mucilaginibacter sp. 5C4]WPX23617.1 PAS domain S-box protein [Mucilaginibacter sp. 5C4]
MGIAPENSLDIESKRLQALNSYGVLDTLPEKEYDAITRLASYICQAPLAFISFIDDKRQWFKSSVGLDIESVPISDSFCRYTILTDHLVEVPDTTQNELFCEAEMVTGEFGIRFYASAPLIDPDGYRIGTLCVFDQKVKHLNDEQRDALRTLADEVMSHLTLRKQKKELEKSLELHKEFSNLFNSSSEIHFIAGADSNIETINDAVLTILGYTPEQAIGRGLWDFVAGKNRDLYVPLIQKAIQSQKPFGLETKTVTRTGEVKHISWTAVNKGGKWFASGRDTTFQQNLIDETRQLSLVASKIRNGVVISNINDEVLWINDAFENITGYSLQDVQGKFLGEVLKGRPKDAEAEAILVEARKNKQPYEVELSMTSKDGRAVWILVTNTVIYAEDGTFEKYIRIITNITARKQAEHDVEILSFAARKSPSGIMIRDAKGEIIWMNEAMEHIIGYSMDELKGQIVGTKLIGPDTNLEVYQDAVQAVKENRPYEVEIKIYKGDGSTAWVFISNSPLFNETGYVERQIGVMVDITERKKVEEELTMLSLVASKTTSGVVINDSAGKVEWVNNAFEKITGYTLDDIKDKHLGDSLKGELTDVSIITKARELSEKKQSFEVDLLIYRRDGLPLWISVINSVIMGEDGKVDKYIETIIDITAKKKAELELISAKEEALQLSRAKDMFIGVMSHEIRTPLNAVIGMSHLLLNDNPLESQKENLSILKFSAENLMTLINDVLDFTKIETGNIELEKANVNMRDMVQSIIGSMKYKADEKNIYLTQSIDESVPDMVLGDRARLVQILLNLVSNSVKFTAKGGVNIDLKVIEQTKETVRIRFGVSDTGIGIAKNKLNTIFELFKQAEADTTRNYGGTGLGLAISKRLIELHDSRINVDSVLGEGSTFWFTITFNKLVNHQTNTKNNVNTGLNINVLVVDDNQINRLLINKVLKKWGATADFAENGQEAIDKLEMHKNFDVVLMDIHMPVMGGLEATGIIRSKLDAYFQKLPIIALTASMLSNQMGQIENAGMNDYILKPFDPTTLFEKLSRYQKQ